MTQVHHSKLFPLSKNKNTQEEMGEDDEEEEDDFINNHDLIGVDGIIEEQKNEINKKKVSFVTLTESNQIIA